MELARSAHQEHKAGQKPSCFGPEPDVTVWHSNREGWKFELLSSRAKRWGRSNLNLDQCETCENVFRTDLAGINSLIQRGRMAGLSSQCLAPRDCEA